MNRIISGIVFLIMTFGAMVALAAPAQAAPLKCVAKNKDVVSITMAKNKKVQVTTVFKTCARPNKPRRVKIKVLNQKFEYRETEHRTKCGQIPGDTLYVQFNSYFWDDTGRNFNPGAVRLECQDDGWNEKVINYRPDRYILNARNSQVKYKTNIKWAFRLVPDVNDVVSGVLRPWGIRPFSTASVV